MKKLLFFLFCIPFLGIAQNSHIINTVGSTFSPSSLIITVGDTVTWNNTAGSHNVNATQATFPNNPEGFGNGVAGAPWSFQWVFTMAGTYDYQCDPHVGIGMTGIINVMPVPGCTDSLACNYNPTATIDDSSCISPDGCTDSLACNYDSLATCDDGSCLITYGCIDSLATNYDPLATCDDGGCVYPLPPAENLFFSEYAEGSSNNKYFEIYNPTSDTVDLTNYAFARVNSSSTNYNGVYEFWVDFDTGAVVLPNDVYVVVHPSADPFIIAVADMYYGSLSNGNDGMALVYGLEPPSPVGPIAGGYVILDWIGDWDADPGQGWNVAGIGAGTRNHTLVRKCPISQGDTSWTNAAGTDPVNSQWIVLSQNDWTNIDFHSACVCDSSTNSYTSITDTICNGLSVVVGNSTYNSTGVYSDTLLAFNGCDSIITTNLTVLSTSASSVINDITICDGDSVEVGSNAYIVTGSYTDILVNSAGCDSIITTNLTVQTPTYQDITICDGDSRVVGSSVYNSTGTYTDTIISSFGCDSIVHTNLTIYSQFNSIFGGIPNNAVGGGNFYSGQQSLELSCYMPSELVSAVIYSQDTTLTTFEIRDINGNVLSDTTVNVIPGGHRIYFNYLMSAGSDYELGVNGGSNNLFRHNSGVSYPYNFGSLASVTSSSAGGNYYYFFYDIEVKQSSQPTNYSICDGESITVAGNVYNTTGLYTDSLTSSIGCDSLVFTNLIVHPNTSYSNNQTICIGETYTINGNIYDTAGTYVDSLQTIAGCDSIVTTNLTILSISAGSSINNQTICIGDSIMLGTSTYFTTGTYYDTLVSSNSCDSIVTTNLTVQTANYASINGGILDTVNGPGAFSNYNGHLLLDASVATLIKSANVYALDTNIVTFELRDSNGLVLESVTHNVYPGIQNLNFNFTLPIGTDYQLGINGGNSGLYRGNADTATFAYPFNSGPVSITSSVAGNQYYYFYYDIEFMPFSSYNEVNICYGDSIVVGSNVYDTPGQYTDVLVANNLCDSIVVTVLDFYQSPQLIIYSSPSPAEICLGETILLEGSTGFSYYWWNNGSTGSSLIDDPTEDTWYLLSAKDSNDCIVKEDIWVFVDSCITGLENLGFEQGELQIYPNPASKQLTIDFRTNATSIKVYNMLGELIVEQKITNSQSSVKLTVNNWRSAAYNMHLHRKDGSIVQKTFNVVKKY